MAPARKLLRAALLWGSAAVALSMAGATLGVPADHADAMAAPQGLLAAIAEIDHASSVTEGGQAYFVNVRQRALTD